MKINPWLFSPCQVRWLLVTTLGLTISPLWFTTAAWGQLSDGLSDGLPDHVTQTEASPADIPRAELTVPQGNGEIIADIQIRLVDAVEDTERSPDVRSEEHTSELQSLTNLVCRLLLEKKKKNTHTHTHRHTHTHNTQTRPVTAHCNRGHDTPPVDHNDSNIGSC